jgi:glycine cleavage system H lipoate-binding protein
MGLAVSVAGAALIASPASATTLDPTNPENARQIYRKMRYRTDSGLVFAWVQGPHMAEIGADLTPMYAINLGTIQRITHRPDGGFDVRDLEISFTTDVETGKPLKEFQNPITGEIVPVTQRKPRVTIVNYSRENELSVPTTYQGSKFEVLHTTPTIVEIGDELFLRDRSRAHLTGPGSFQRTLNEISTFSAPRSVVLDPRVTSVSSKVQSNDVTSWPSWLKMGSRPGILALYGVGGKAPNFAAMPADWLALVSEFWPDIAADPVAALDRPIEG